jgi:hypothetical protein
VKLSLFIGLLLLPVILCAQQIYDFDYNSAKYASSVTESQALALSGYIPESFALCDTVSCSLLDSLHLKPGHDIYVALDSNRIDKFRVVIINEAHDNPYNRLFIQKLLPYFFNKGFHVLADEALHQSVTKRPLSVKTGSVLIQDPFYHNMFDKALDLGYWLMPYDSFFASRFRLIRKDSIGNEKTIIENTDMYYEIKVINGQKVFYNMTNRDSASALRIYKELMSHPDEKILIHVGYGHGDRFGKTLGHYLEQLLGQKVFIINQSFFREPYSLSCNKIIAGLTDSCNRDFIIDTRQLPDSKKLYKYGDLFVLHSPTCFNKGTPVWPESNDQCKSVDLLHASKLKKYIHTGELIVIFDAKEYKTLGNDALAVGCIPVLKSSSPVLAYLVPDKKYLFRIKINDRTTKNIYAKP